jgi:hypothetical protein
LLRLMEALMTLVAKLQGTAQRCEYPASHNRVRKLPVSSMC